MNVLFHTTTAFCIAVALTGTKRIEKTSNRNLVAVLAFVIGIISHGILDLTPHCYHINSKLDAIAGLSMILILTWRVNKQHRIILCLAFLGAILPAL